MSYHAKRREMLRRVFSQNNLDAYLLSDFYNLFYFTGLHTLAPEERESFALITREKCFLFTDSRYAQEARALQSSEVIFAELKQQKGLLTWLKELIQDGTIHTIGFEEDNLTCAEYNAIASAFSGDCTWEPTKGMGAGLRTIKDSHEIEMIRTACQIGDRCLQEIIPTIGLGTTEREIAFRLEMHVKQQGYDLAFDPIVALDAHASLPHYNTKQGNGMIAKGSLLLIDFGVTYQSYNSDITRMFYFEELSSEKHTAYEQLKKIQIQTIDKIQEGSVLKELDEQCRTSLIQAGFPEYGHSTGHGIGLEVHEMPKVSPVSTEVIQPGMVFTIEPGIYLENDFGMRLEDTIGITSENKPELLTKYPKDIQRLSS
ncbi:aminopeptidase P family protein [Candidatus Roizmanbacteria bacterium]|nr:aminopeptidase P family protein [Candidatus Roizmanbacteria bacterium]